MDIHLTVRHTENPPERAEVLSLAGRILARFNAEIRRLDLVMEDENGPRGGVGQRCAAELVLVDGRTVHSSRRHSDAGASVRLALQTLREHLAKGIGARKGREDRDYL
jgi:hypothetical protein